MTFESKPKSFVVCHCDTCSEYIEIGHVQFSEALDGIKAQGWRVYKGPDKQWAHACPACTEDYAEETAAMKFISHARDAKAKRASALARTLGTNLGTGWFGIQFRSVFIDTYVIWMAAMRLRSAASSWKHGRRIANQSGQPMWCKCAKATRSDCGWVQRDLTAPQLRTRSRSVSFADCKCLWLKELFQPV
jgi:hypothetical protein